MLEEYFMTLSIYLVERCTENTFSNCDYPSPQRTSCFRAMPIEELATHSVTLSVFSPT
jgi:hypothetical protein